VSTTRTRAAGLAALVTPVLLVVGQYLNVTVDRGFVHGIGVVLLTAVIPTFAFVLCGLRARHSGLGRLGQAAIVTAIVAPFVSFAGVHGYFAAIGLLGLSVVVLVVAMLRAHVLPALPLVLLATGPVGLIGVIMSIESEGADVFMAYPMVLALVGYVWLGWHLFREPIIDTPGRHHTPPATA
jgi:hypothetical protein